VTPDPVETVPSHFAFLLANPQIRPETIAADRAFSGIFGHRAATTMQSRAASQDSDALR